MTILISLTAGIFIYTIISIIFPRPEKDVVKKRVTKYLKSDMMEQIQEDVLKESKRTQKGSRLNARVISGEFAALITSSGIKMTPVEFLSMWIGSTVIPMFLAAIIKGSLVSIIAAGIIGIALPPIILRRTIKKRQELFTVQLGEAILIIINSLKGGFSIQQSISRVASEMAPPLSDEFEKTMREVRYGISIEEALENMAERVNNRDLDIFVSSILTSTSVGSNLTEILETISNTIKDRIRITQEVKVLTASGRISAIVIGLLPVVLILVLMLINPDYFDFFFYTTIGRILIVISAVLEIIGFLIIRRIADIRY